MASRLHRTTRPLALALLAAIACQGEPRRTPDDTLVMLIESTMTTADPRFAASGYDGKLSKLVNAGLTVVDSPTLEPQLALAAKIDRVDDLTYDVTLRPDAKFSDGSPVLASDVAGTYTYMLDPKTESLFHKSLSDRFASVVATGERTVRFHLKTKLATFFSDIDFGIVSFARGAPEPGQTIGAGPFVVREITPWHVLLDANPHYFGGPPKTPHVEIKFVKDASARLVMLVGGSADLVQNAVRLDLVDQVLQRPGIRMEADRSVFLTYMLLNNSDPLLADRRVRHAIALALDRPQLVAAKFGGRAVLATGLLPPTHWAYEPDVARYDHDLARAKRLLDEAGHRDPDGDGPQPRFTVVYKTSSDAFRVSVARTIVAQLAAVGIDVELRSFEFGTFFADVKRGNYQLATMQTADINEPDFYFTYFHSSWIPSPKNPDGYNRWRYTNPEVDRLTEAGRREPELAERKRIYSRVQQLVAEDLPIIPLFHEDNIVLMNADVRGYELTPNARLTGLRHAYKVKSGAPDQF